MSKAEEFAYSKYPKDKKGVLYDLARNSIIEGYRQAEKDLIENEHKKSWRLDEQLWSGFKDIEEASYQYIYDASNDWMIEIPVWNDVQEGFKAGAKWQKERMINKACKWLKEHATFMHPRKQRPVCMINLNVFREAMEE